MRFIITTAILLLSTGAFAQKRNDISLTYHRGYTRMLMKNPNLVTTGAFSGGWVFGYTRKSRLLEIGTEVGLWHLHDNHLWYSQWSHSENLYDVRNDRFELSTHTITCDVAVGINKNGLRIGMKAGFSVGANLYSIGFYNATPIGGNIGTYIEYVKYFNRVGLGVGLSPTMHLMQYNSDYEKHRGLYTIYTVPISAGVHYRF